MLLVGSVVAPVGSVSANSPEYNGSVTLNGASASDGSQFNYDLESTDGVDNFSVSLTGTVNEQPTTISGSTNPSTSETVSLDGDLAPTDSSISVALVTSEISDSGSLSGVAANTATASTTVSLDGDRLTQLSFDGNYDSVINAAVGGSYEVTVDGDVVGSFNKGDPMTVSLNKSISGSTDIEVYQTGGQYHIEDITWTATTLSTPESVDVSANGGSTTTLNDGESTDLDLGLGSNQIDIDPNVNGVVDYDISSTERTQTHDPSVTINGNEVGHDGLLADGETVDLNVDESWIKNGTNNVSVSTTDPESGPGSLVDLDYSHDSAGPVQTTTLDSTTWDEFYNVSNTYGSDVSNTVVTLPFSSKVVDIDEVEMRTNGGSWQSANSWDLSGGNLGVNIGAVSAGDTVDVRGRGRKVDIENGQIDVTKPTVEGDRLSTEFEIVNADTGFGIDVGGTTEGSKLHYLDTSSWDRSETTEFGDSQTVRMPNAPTGGTATMTTAPIEVDVLAGDVQVEWAEDATNTEPRFHVTPDEREGDTVSYAFTGGIDGTEYSLYSETEGIVRDSGTANSPVWFEDDDSKETFQILTEGSSSIETGDGGGGGFFESPSSAVRGAAERAAGIMPVVDPIWVVVLVVGLIGGAVAYTDRRGSPTRSTPLYRRPVVGLGVIVAGVLAVFLISPATFTQPLQTTLGAVLPLAGILAVVGGAFWLVSLRGGNGGSGGSGDSTQSTTEKMVALVPLRRSNDEQTGDGATDDGWFK